MTTAVTGDVTTRAGAAVDAWCEKRTADVAHALALLPGHEPLAESYATLDPRAAVTVAGYATMRLRLAAAAHDEEAVRTVLDELTDIAAVLRHGYPVWAPKAYCVRIEDPRYGSTLFLPRRVAPVREHAELESAIDRLRAAGFGPILDLGLRCAVLLDSLAADAPMNSFTVRTLPGTLWTDDIACGVRLAEAILHESAHSALNHLLDAFGIVLPSDLQYFSPWKRRLRPAFGFLHAAFAFSTLCRYWEVAAASGTAAQSDYCSRRLATEAQHLAAVKPDLRDALRLVPDGEVRAVLEGVCGC